jgi:hypothetical protein
MRVHVGIGPLTDRGGRATHHHGQGHKQGTRDPHSPACCVCAMLGVPWQCTSQWFLSHRSETSQLKKHIATVVEKLAKGAQLVASPPPASAVGLPAPPAR